MRATRINREVTRIFEANHPSLGSLDVETVFDEVFPTGVSFISTIRLTQGQCKHICGDRWEELSSAVQDEFEGYMTYEDGEGSYRTPLVIDGLKFTIGDGDDSLAVQITDCSRTISIWVRSLDEY